MITLRPFEKYRVRIYPAVIFSYDKPHRAEKNRFSMAFPDLDVLQFQYRVIQLNRLSWKDFVRNPNPVAIALMAKMRIATKDRPYVRLECLRLLATLRLDPARSRLIGGFVETYLRLNAREMRVFEKELATLMPAEKEATMTLNQETLQELDLLVASSRWKDRLAEAVIRVPDVSGCSA